jgi:hypothetical protein
MAENAATAMMPMTGRSYLNALVGKEEPCVRRGGDGGEEQIALDRAAVRMKAAKELAAFSLNWNPKQTQPVPMFGECPLEGYWRGTREEWPCLTYMAFAILSVPPSSADVERLFSRGGFTLSPLRMNLDPERVNKMLVTQGNWDDQLYKRFDWEMEEEAAKKKEANKKRSESITKVHQQKKEKKQKPAAKKSEKKSKKDMDKGQASISSFCKK